MNKYLPGYQKSLERKSQRQLKGLECRNCGNELHLEHNFCSRCGQSNDFRKLSLHELLRETAASMFSFDSRLYYSLRPLVIRPGSLAREFIDGKRQRFIHPIRFYLSISLIFFLTQGLRDYLEKSPTVSAEKSENALSDSIKNDSTVAEKALELDLSNDGSDAGQIIIPLSEDENTKWTIDTTSGSALSLIAAFIEDHKETPYTEGLDALGLKHSFWNKWTYIEYQKFRNADLKEMGKFFLSKMPIVIFLFLPIFGLVFIPLYWKKKITYIEHLVFIFYNQAYLFLLLWLSLLLDYLLDSSLFSALSIFYFAIYLIFAFKRFYNQSRWMTIFKYFMVQFSFIIVSSFFFILSSVVLFLFYQ